MNGRPSELYVYYRVASANQRAALQAVREQQRHLCALQPGLQARVLQRSDEPGDTVTLMEVYRFDGRGVDESLRARIDGAASALTPWLIGARHVERFDAVD